MFSASKKVDLASRSKVSPKHDTWELSIFFNRLGIPEIILVQFQIKSKPASIKPNVGLQGPRKTTKQVSVCPQVSQVCIRLSDILVIRFFHFHFSYSERVVTPRVGQLSED